MHASVLVRSLATPCLALVIASGCATDPAPRPFDMADTNGDQQVSKAELEHYVSGGLFAYLDRNGDGRVPLEEWRQFDNTMTDAMFDERDADGDGAVTHEELKTYFDRQDSLDRVLAEIDTNGDGHIDRAEAEAYRAKIQPDTAARS